MESNLGNSRVPFGRGHEVTNIFSSQRIRMFKVSVGTRCAHTEGTGSAPKTTQNRPGIYINIPIIAG